MKWLQNCMRVLDLHQHEPSGPQKQVLGSLTVWPKGAAMKRRAPESISKACWSWIRHCTFRKSLFRACWIEATANPSENVQFCVIIFIVFALSFYVQPRHHSASLYTYPTDIRTVNVSAIETCRRRGLHLKSSFAQFAEYECIYIYVICMYVCIRMYIYIYTYIYV